MRQTTLSISVQRCVIFAAFMCAALPRAWSLDGVVMLPDGRPAADAVVSIAGQPGSVRATAEGRFRWSPSPPVPFDLLVTLPGGFYAPPITVDSLPADG